MTMPKPPHRLRPLSEIGRSDPDADSPPEGIVCWKCGCKMFVTTTDRLEGKIRRYRRCRHCGTVRATIEK